MSLLPLPKENTEALIGHLNDRTAVEALSQAIGHTAFAFSQQFGRRPTVLVVGPQCGVVAAHCASIAEHTTVVSPHEVELLLAERYLAKDGVASERFTLVNKWEVQLPADMGVDMLVMDAFGGHLHSRGAAVIAWDLFARGVIATHDGGQRYCVPQNGVMTARLYHCPALSTTSIHRNAVCDIGIKPELPAKWVDESWIPGGLAAAEPISERVQVCSEEYGADNSPDQRIITHPKYISLVPTASSVPLEECVVALEWVVSLDDEGRYLMGTSLGMARGLPVIDQLARNAAWPRPCLALGNLADAVDTVHCKVDYKVNGTFGVTRVGSIPKAQISQEHFIPDRKLKTIVQTTFAKVVG